MRLPFVNGEPLSRARREERMFYLFVTPWLIGLTFFWGGPVLAAMGLSFTDWSGVNLSEIQFIGLENYGTMFADDLFWESVRNTLFYAVGSVVVGTAFALFLAILLNQKIPGLPFFRSIFYLPSVTAGVAVALVWIWILNPRVGLLNYGLSLLGIDGPKWLHSSDWVLPALIIMSLFRVGPSMIILLAGLQGIPQNLYEAAEIDGAGRWAKLRNITIPMLSPALFFVLVVSTVGSFQIFTEIKIMTDGGPGTSSFVLVWYLWQQAFVYLRMGYASAVAFVLFIVVMILVGIQFWVGNRLVYYES
jgi:multiple sugar transport system permease protein